MKRKPLKRHPSLIPLSRGHHRGLVLAQLLKPDVPDYGGLPTTIAGKVAYTQTLFQESLRKQFEQELEHLAPQTRGYSAELDAMTERIEKGQREILQIIGRLGPQTTVAELGLLGQMLERHIRLKEREWFMLIQEALPVDILDRLSLE